MLSDRYRPDEAPIPGLAMLGIVEAPSPVMARPRQCDAINYRQSRSTRWCSPPPCRRTGGSKSACTGFSTSASTRIARETGETLDRKTSQRSGNAHSTFSAPRGRISPSDANASAPAGPTSSPVQSSAKCDSLRRRRCALDTGARFAGAHHHIGLTVLRAGITPGIPRRRRSRTESRCRHQHNCPTPEQPVGHGVPRRPG
jgi:hypothetical protein